MPRKTRKQRRKTIRRIPRRHRKTHKRGGGFPMLPPTEGIKISNPESSDNVLGFKIK